MISKNAIKIKTMYNDLARLPTHPYQKDNALRHRLWANNPVFQESTPKAKLPKTTSPFGGVFAEEARLELPAPSHRWRSCAAYIARQMAREWAKKKLKKTFERVFVFLNFLIEIENVLETLFKE